MTDRLSERIAQQLNEAAAELRGCCDFCGTHLRGPAALYPARKFEHHPGNHLALRDTLLASGVAIVVHDAGGWAACPTCDRLVRSGRRRELADRMAKRLARRYGSSLRRTRPYAQAAHDLFWANRAGPPTTTERSTR